MIVTFIPAAGKSSRMRGRDKLLEDVAGETALRRAARIALEAGLGPVIVGLGAEDGERRETLSGVPVRIIVIPDATEGMAATLRAGARAALAVIGTEEGSAMLIHLPDMPEIEVEDLGVLALAFGKTGSIVRGASADGQSGHPVLVPADRLGEFEALRGDSGARTLLERHDMRLVRLLGRRALCDLDTPEDWAAWRAGLLP